MYSSHNYMLGSAQVEYSCVSCNGSLFLKSHNSKYMCFFPNTLLRSFLFSIKIFVLLALLIEDFIQVGFGDNFLAQTWNQFVNDR
jgi:hypothetical protein